MMRVSIEAQHNKSLDARRNTFLHRGNLLLSMLLPARVNLAFDNLFRRLKWRNANNMKSILKHIFFVLPSILPLLLVVCVAGQSKSVSQKPAFLEISYTNMSFPSDSNTLKVFSDGTYLGESKTMEKAKSGRDRSVYSREEKLLESGEIAELQNWLEDIDFSASEAKYAVTTVIDNPDWFNITYRKGDQEKVLKVVNYGRGTETERRKVPIPVIKLLTWSEPDYFQYLLKK